MTPVSSIRSLPAFKKENVHIRNDEELLEKVNKIIQDGPDKLQIVTDFDYTITRHKTDDGEPVLTSFAMFYACPSTTQACKDENKRLENKYKPIMNDSTLSTEEKTKQMINWWIAAHDLLKGVKFPRFELMDLAKTLVKSFRKGVVEMIKWSEIHQVPVLVFSAGLGDCVISTLEAADLLLPHVKVVSNCLVMNKDDYIEGFKGELIHMYNKNETAIRNTEYYDLVHQRCNVVLMGDSDGDANMADGMDHCSTIIKVGFLGSVSNLDNFLKKFDIVVVNEHSIDVVNNILQCIM